MRAVLLAVSVLSLAGCHGGGGEGPILPDNAMPVRVEAPEGTAYQLRCRFQTVSLPGSGKVNSIDLSGKGPRDGAIPTDNTRCTLRITKGEGPVSVTVTKQGATAATTRVAGPGATGTLQVL